ncbi:uncharacterized protein LOC144886126 [Branchiostoma floridae x Branchiostoma japonicum]
MASSLTKTPKECTDPPVSTDTLQKYEDDLQDKTRKWLIDDCKALKSKNHMQELQAEKAAKENEELVAKNRELTAKIEELTSKIEELEQNNLTERVKKLEEEIRSINCDRKKDADTFKQELEECKKQVQQAQEAVFQPILGILQRQQELLRRENPYAKVCMRADENPYEEIQPGPPPKDAIPTHQKELCHPKVNNINTVNSQHFTLCQHFQQENVLPNAHSLRNENPTKPPPHDNGPAHPPLHDQNLKAPVQSTDSLPTSSEESEPVSSNGEVMV